MVHTRRSSAEEEEQRVKLERVALPTPQQIRKAAEAAAAAAAGAAASTSGTARAADAPADASSTSSASSSTSFLSPLRIPAPPSRTPSSRAKASAAPAPSFLIGAAEASSSSSSSSSSTTTGSAGSPTRSAGRAPAPSSPSSSGAPDAGPPAPAPATPPNAQQRRPAARATTPDANADADEAPSTPPLSDTRAAAYAAASPVPRESTPRSKRMRQDKGDDAAENDIAEEDGGEERVQRALFQGDAPPLRLVSVGSPAAARAGTPPPSSRALDGPADGTPPPAAAAAAAAAEAPKSAPRSILVRRRPRSPTSQVKKKTSRLLFSPDPPREHEFMLRSPPARRLDPFIGRSDEAAVRLELAERGLLTDCVVRREDREYLARLARGDLCRELMKSHGISAFSTEPEDMLVEKLELARSLRRRAELRRCGVQLPSEMALADVQAALRERRVQWQGLTHARAARALELALLKEDAKGLVGDGYQFGRRVVSVRDVLSLEDPSDRELRAILKRKGVSDVPRKKQGKMELVRSIVETEEEVKLRYLVRDEIMVELRRRKVQGFTESPSRPAARSPHAPANPDRDAGKPAAGEAIASAVVREMERRSGSPSAAPVSPSLLQPMDLEYIFNRLYASGAWRAEYDDVDLTEAKLPPLHGKPAGAGAGESESAAELHAADSPDDVAADPAESRCAIC